MDDRSLILSLGGPAQLARRLGYGKWGTNRVCNWMARGIPAAVKIEFPEIFLTPSKPAKKAQVEGKSVTRTLRDDPNTANSPNRLNQTGAV